MAQKSMGSEPMTDRVEARGGVYPKRVACPKQRQGAAPAAQRQRSASSRVFGRHAQQPRLVAAEHPAVTQHARIPPRLARALALIHQRVVSFEEANLRRCARRSHLRDLKQHVTAKRNERSCAIYATSVPTRTRRLRRCAPGRAHSLHGRPDRSKFSPTAPGCIGWPCAASSATYSASNKHTAGGGDVAARGVSAA